MTELGCEFDSQPMQYYNFCEHKSWMLGTLVKVLPIHGLVVQHGNVATQALLYPALSPAGRHSQSNLCSLNHLLAS